MEGDRLPVIILAGGKSTRLGRDKASALVAGKSLLQRTLEASTPVASAYVLVKARGQSLPRLQPDVPVTEVEDLYPETGPLGGILTGLTALPAEKLALVLACDLPLIQPALLTELVRLSPGHDAVVPLRAGLPEPVLAVYATTCIEPARGLIEAGAYKAANLLDRVDALRLPESHWRRFDPEGLSFLNVNREEDLHRAENLAAGC